MSCIIDGDDNLNALEPLVISRGRRKEIDCPLNSTESKHFRLLNLLLG